MKAALATGALLWAAAASALTLESCVSSDAVQVGAERHAWLDGDDLRDTATAIGERFPQLQRDGFVPSRLLLWDRPGAGWVYVAVIENPERSGAVCFTASISAGTVAITKPLLRKYFPDLRAT